MPTRAVAIAVLLIGFRADPTYNGVTNRHENGLPGPDPAAAVLPEFASDIARYSLRFDRLPVYYLIRLPADKIAFVTRSDSDRLAGELAQAMTRLRARLRLESAPDTWAWTWSQLNTLVRIATVGSSTAAELAQAEHVRPQSMAETVAALKRERLVVGRSDPADGRKVLLDATDEGRRLAATIPALREAWLDAAMHAALDDHEREQLGAAVALMNRLADWPNDTPRS